MTLTHFAERLTVDLSLPVLGLSWLGFEHQTFRMRGKRSYPPIAALEWLFIQNQIK